MNEDWSKEQHHFALRYDELADMLAHRLKVKGRVTRLFLEPDGEYIHLFIEEDKPATKGYSPGSYIEIEGVPMWSAPFVQKAP